VLYSPAFEMELSKCMDCITGDISLGSSPIADDGRFSFQLPDLADDPSLAPFRDKGSFEFRVVDAPGRPAYGLLLGPPAMVGAYPSNPPLAVANRYDGVLRFFPNPLDRAFLDAVHALASDLTPGLPGIPLGTWLDNLFGPIFWDANTCGPQASDPSSAAAQDLPLCVTAHVGLAGGRRLDVSLLVGTIKKGASGTPAFSSGEIVDANGDSQRITSLADLPSIAATLPGR
jgi:hypothetical protein